MDSIPRFPTSKVSPHLFLLTGVERGLILVLLLTALALLSACGGDGEEGADDGADHTAGGHTADPGVVSPKPADATQVNVTLREWAVAPAQPSVRAGKVYFLVENTGPDHPHELVVIRTELGPLNLPFENNMVPEDRVDIVDEIEEFAPRSSASFTVDLAPGKYLLVCNLTDEDAAIGNHYKKGMVAVFSVE